ncbi:MAG: hypothetical protein IKI01_06645 [Lachnospiraceae bacterium]|nr:hypothetical protein [Lachnospiraceae bacterium]
MAVGSIGAAEFERLVARTGNEKFLARPYAGRKDGMPVSECVRMAAANDRAIAAANATLSGRDPLITRLSVLRAWNILAARGRQAESMTLSLTVPADMPESELRAYMREAYAVTELSDVSIVRTDASTVTATATVFGGSADGAEPIASGQEYHIILTGLAGGEKTLLLYEANKERLSAKYPKHFLNEIPQLAEGLDQRKACETGWLNGAAYMYALGDGGVYAGLYAMSGRIRTGLRIDLPDITISQKTIEVCEELDIDPYQIGSGGCVLMVTDDPEKLLSALWKEDIEAADIGRLTDTNAKELHNGEEVRYLEPYRGG